MTQRKLSLLFIEDDEQIRDLTTMILQRDGHAVTATEQAQKAIDLLKENHYDLVLSDFYLEDTTGHELIKSIRAFNSSIPIIIATGNRELVADALEGGHTYIIHKPFKARELTALISEVVC